MSIVDGLMDELRRRDRDAGEARRLAIETDARFLLDSSRALLSLQPGEFAPDFQLPNADGVPVRLLQALPDGPAVVTFYRGQWCAYCARFLGALETALPEIRQAGGQVLAISPQTPGNTVATVRALGLSYDVLSDVGNVIARQFGLVYRLPETFRQVYDELGINLPQFNGTESFELPVPATYVIGRDARITEVYIDPDYTQRPDPPDIVAAVRRLQDGAASAHH